MRLAMLMSGIHRLDHLVGPWQRLYSHSKAVAVTVTFIHLAAMLAAGGLALAADRITLRARRGSPDERWRCLRHLRSVHRPVLVGLSVVFMSGVLLVAADFETFLTSPVYWLKMGLVALLLANGLLLTRAEDTIRRGDDELGWPRLVWSARASIALWLTSVLAGTVLTSAS